MVDINKILEEAKQRDASDVHLICGLKPMLRISRELTSIEEVEELTNDDMYEIYD